MPSKPELIWQKGAVDDLFRLREFLRQKNPKAALNAAKKIIATANFLLEQPYLGHPIEDMPEFHKLKIPFGKNNYVMKYRINEGKIIILRVWHSREDHSL
jgi:plasmid stabilization system protein ParE